MNMFTKQNKAGLLSWLAVTSMIPVLFTACGAVRQPEYQSGGNAEISETAPQKEQNTHDLSTGYALIPEGEDYAELHPAADDSSVSARIYQDEPVTVYSISGDWAEVTYGGIQGYLKLSYLSFTKPEKKTAEANAEDTAQKAENPENAAISAEVPATEAQAVQEKAVQQDVKIENNIQLVFATDSDGVEIATPASYADYVPESSGELAWCSTQSTYIYAQASTSSYKREANMLYYGDVCQILGSVNEWYYISTDSGSGYDLHGYVKKAYITKGATPAAQELGSAASCGKVNVKSANVRSSPDKSTDNNILFTLYNGATFDVLSYDGYWYKINYNGTVCYISHKMVEVW